MKTDHCFRLSRLQWNKFQTIFPAIVRHELARNPQRPRSLTIEISVEIKLSCLNGLSRYQSELIQTIDELRQKSWTYKEISDYLNSKGLKTTRGKPFRPNHVERMLKKYQLKIQRENYLKISL